MFSKKIDIVTCGTLELIIIRKEELTGDAEVIEDISDFIRKNKAIPRIIKHRLMLKKPRVKPEASMVHRQIFIEENVA